MKRKSNFCTGVQAAVTRGILLVHFLTRIRVTVKLILRQLFP